MEMLWSVGPPTATFVVVVVVLWIAGRLLGGERAATAGHGFRNQVVLLGLTALGALVFVLVLPISDAMRGQLLGLIGIVLSAAIALSSTTFLGNALAGVMLRAVRNFRIGDFIRTGDQFGRVSERGLFHTEIQTEDRDLTTVPNLYLVTHPVTTVRTSGTIVSASVSLGYDVPRAEIKEALLAAAEATGLSDPFVQILELGDFSVSYRVAGLLAEVKQILTMRSRLRGAVLDALHRAGIEIVSPSFMNQRVLDPGHAIIPRPSIDRGETVEARPEELVFDKAELAESIESLREQRKQLEASRQELKRQIEAEGEGTRRDALQAGLAALEAREARLEKIIAAREARAAD